MITRLLKRLAARTIKNSKSGGRRFSVVARILLWFKDPGASEGVDDRLLARVRWAARRIEDARAQKDEKARKVILDEVLFLRVLTERYVNRGENEVDARSEAIEDLADKYPNGLREAIERHPGTLKIPYPFMKRAKAEKLKAEFLKRVDYLRREASYDYEVDLACVFGSYLDKKGERLGDLDVAVKLRPKRRTAQPERRSRDFLEGDLEGLRVHDMQEILDCRYTHVIIYP